MTISPDEPNNDAKERSVEDSIEVSVERELDVIEASLAAIEHALDALDDGTYGQCEVCANPIEPTRLEARSSERRCFAHAVE